MLSLTGKIFGLLALLTSDVSFAAVIQLTPQDDLQLALDRSQAGDILILGKGEYRGNFILRQSIELAAQEGAVIDAGGKGHALQIEAENSYVHDLRIVNWGEDLTNQDAGILLATSAMGSRIEYNSLYGGGFGVWVDATQAAKISNNRIRGKLELRASDRGNGIHLFNVTQALIEGNEVWETRDGIYIDTSNKNKLIDNYLHDLRYGVHYMYAYNNLLKGNLTENTRTGYALMQSKYLTVLNNRSVNDVNYGILMNYITNSTLRNNEIRGIQNRHNPHMQKTGTRAARRAGLEGKALFIYNSLFNEFTDNRFSDSDIGIHLTAASEDNTLKGNAFVNNKTQVKYVSTRTQDWAGNYWSDYLGWDMNGDGIGDIKYEPNDSVDRLLWKFPTAKLLLNSPAIETLRWVQRQFPVLKGPGVIDSQPLMVERPQIPVKMVAIDEGNSPSTQVQAGEE
ncbi:nitrous oxide reductase family maturation protein NosD [Microbulbifer sp. OS29]|uniref:Nitrous oxide reductase family maturation protein NosD n=1 Tax=Microbulbifer okhotskensis TaxID=2926617 RepID=A0A9X2ER97_9GAMM|nr:nitrous oxide reductase family maturation protein NosD [Microbulbifer okhotskensis]MCO1336386.1 nitrous oxide reductase family maturation protein NosD [Microbulbifer okhotskensis]